MTQKCVSQIVINHHRGTLPLFLKNKNGTFRIGALYLYMKIHSKWQVPKHNPGVALAVTIFGGLDQVVHLTMALPRKNSVCIELCTHSNELTTLCSAYLDKLSKLVLSATTDCHAHSHTVGHMEVCRTHSHTVECLVVGHLYH